MTDSCKLHIQLHPTEKCFQGVAKTAACFDSMACLSLAAAVQKAAKHGGEDRAPKTAAKLPLPLAAAVTVCGKKASKPPAVPGKLKRMRSWAGLLMARSRKTAAEKKKVQKKALKAGHVTLGCMPFSVD